MAGNRPGREAVVTGYPTEMDDIAINDTRARAFAETLQTFEQDGDAAALAALFADGATVERLDARGPRTDVEQFWREYRDQFRDVATTFTHVVDGTDACVLEWTSDAHLPDGRPVDCRGVTILELGEDKVTGLRTYYDSAVFTRLPAEAVASTQPDR